jgi:hypothetical protein
VKGKPTELSYWQKAHRPWKDQALRMKTLTEFETEWQSWWKSLQPDSRCVDGAEHMQSPDVNMDWATLCVPGRNGFLLIMVSLAWWGKFSGCSETWKSAMLDVTAALVCLCASSQSPVASTSKSLKRKHPALGPAVSGNTPTHSWASAVHKL